jgi:hypothetical protein
MSAVASVTFPFDGTEQEFARLYKGIADLDLEIAAYPKGTTGVVEFMIDDFANFRERVAARAANLGLNLVALDYLVSEKKA